MRKLSFKDGDGFESFLGFVCCLLRIRFFECSDEEKCHEYAHYRVQGKRLPGDIAPLILAPLDVFLEMYKDMADTFKPYKGYYQFWRELLWQPLYGAKNILLGLINFMGSLASFLIGLGIFILAGMATPFIFLLDCVIGTNFFKPFGSYFVIASVMLSAISLPWMANAITQTIRGITQLIATPVTWFAKIPLRWAITAVKGFPKVEDSATIRHLAGKAMVMLDEDKIDNRIFCSILYIIHFKQKRAEEKGQKTGIKDAEEKYKKCKLAHGKYSGAPLSEEEKSFTYDYLKLYAMTSIQKFLFFSTPQLDKFNTSLEPKPQYRSGLDKDALIYIGSFYNKLNT